MFNSTLRYGILSQLGPKFPTSGLTAYWSFDESSGTIAHDSKGSNGGIANNSRVLGGAGFHNNGADFTQGDDYINFDYPEMGTHIQEMSISFWIKDLGTNINNYIFSLFDTGTNGNLAYELKINENTTISVYLRGYIGDNQRTSGNYNVSSLNLDDGNWHHCVVTQKASTNTINIYIDGDKKTTTYDFQQPTSGFADFKRPIIMGTRKIGDTIRTDLGVSDCKIDEVCTWNRLLTQDEVTRIYNSGNGKFYKPVFPSNGLYSYWSFDESSGTIAYDSKGSNDGTANNSRVLGSTGFHKNGADFTQGNDYINIGKPEIDLTLEHTISFWFTGSTSSNLEDFIASFSDGTNFGYRIGKYEDNTLNLYLRTDDFSLGYNPYHHEVSSTIFEDYLDGNWHLLTYTHTVNSSDCKFYLDGVPKTLTIVKYGERNDASVYQYDFYIGAQNNRGIPDKFFNGKLDEFGIWDRILTPDEIYYLYNSGNGKFY